MNETITLRDALLEGAGLIAILFAVRVLVSAINFHLWTRQEDEWLRSRSRPGLSDKQGIDRRTE